MAQTFQEWLDVYAAETVAKCIAEGVTEQLAEIRWGGGVGVDDLVVDCDTGDDLLARASKTAFRVAR